MHCTTRKQTSEKETCVNDNNKSFSGGLAAYFKAYPTVKFINKTMIIAQTPQNLNMPNMTQLPNAMSRPGEAK